MTTTNTAQSTSRLLRFAVEKLELEADAVPGAYARLLEAASLIAAVGSLSKKVAPCCQWVLAVGSMGLSALGAAFLSNHGHGWLKVNEISKTLERPLSALGKGAVGGDVWPAVDAQTNVTAFANIFGTTLSVISRMNALKGTGVAKALSATAATLYGVMGAFQTKLSDLLRTSEAVVSASVGAQIFQRVPGSKSAPLHSVPRRPSAPDGR